jgi:hypothetical protein
MDGLNIVAVGEHFINLSAISCIRGNWDQLVIKLLDGSEIELSNEESWLIYGELLRQCRDLEEESDKKKRWANARKGTRS